LGISLNNLNTDKKDKKPQKEDEKKSISVQLQFDF